MHHSACALKSRIMYLIGMSISVDKSSYYINVIYHWDLIDTNMMYMKCIQKYNSRLVKDNFGFLYGDFSLLKVRRTTTFHTWSFSHLGLGLTLVLAWYQWWEFSIPNPNLEEYRNAILKCFQPSIVQSVSSLKQTKIMKEYKEQFVLYASLFTWREFF